MTKKILNNEPNVDNNVGEAEDKNFGKLFLCDPSWYETLEDEEDSVRLHVYDALFKYRLTGEVPELSAVEKVYFKFMTHAVDRFDKGKKEHDKETSRVRSINGKKGAEARWGKEKMANDGKNGKNGHTIPIHTIPSPNSMCIVNNTSSNADASEASSEAPPSGSSDADSIQDYYNSQVSLCGARLRQSKGLSTKRRTAILGTSARERTDSRGGRHCRPHLSSPMGAHPDFGVSAQTPTNS